ncbi:unnamed protein product [Miscanthus lutarioriparius]|uniref:Uncharacterized protein n=1 Tax=Miscanthus lutarioriparius TaxID=422564 RepID=A0A811R7M0_9POAL|nr:unnamed protein product [Miscanthus lutarioriparius]
MLHDAQLGVKKLAGMFWPWSGAVQNSRTDRRKTVPIATASKKLGRQVCEIEAWVHTHRGSNPEDITSLNTEEATACLEKYKAKAMELNGPDFDWLHSPVDVRALYECSCGRPHGKWATFNGMVNDKEVLPDLRRSRESAMAARRQRQEEDERLRREAHDGRVAKEYAQNVSAWSTMHDEL